MRTRFALPMAAALLLLIAPAARVPALEGEDAAGFASETVAAISTAIADDSTVAQDKRSSEGSEVPDEVLDAMGEALEDALEAVEDAR